MAATADPWAGLERAVQRRQRAQHAQSRHSPKPLEDSFPESLLARAAKRVVVEAGDARWMVKGDARLGDAKQHYSVTLDRGKYACTCEVKAHGRRRLCSHVVAVIQRRREGFQVSQRDNEESRGEGASRASIGEGDADPGLLEGPAGDGHVRPQAPPPPPTQSNSGLRPSASDVPDPRDPRFGTPPLPDWVSEIRPHQWDAVQEVVEGFREGKRVMWVDAPTGSGKTLIGELVRREVNQRALYVCHGLTLQDQFLRDFPYAAVLKGRSNYPTQWGQEGVTAADCTRTPGDADSCLWCDAQRDCPYEQAKFAALKSPIAVLNTAYFLAESNHVGRIEEGRGLVIADECDVLEGELMGYVEFSLGERVCKQLGVDPPAKGSHRRTIARWMTEELEPAVIRRLRQLPETFDGMADVKVIREANGLRRLRGQMRMIAGQLMDDGWVRDNDAGPLAMKPVHVGWAGESALWKHGERWLCMSATIISPEEMADSLGLEGEWGVVRVPMTFPVERRRIHVAPVANMVNAEKDTAWPAMGAALRRVVARHPSERVLVHAVSYALAERLTRDLGECGGRRVITYRSAGQRDRAVAEFRATEGAVLVAPSLDRGVDLKDDDCRVVVVAKVPFPYLGNSQVSARANGPGGNTWYAVQTVRSLVQMTGRHVRSASDWGVTYILDAQFVRNVWKKNKGLLPQWWREAVDMGFDTRELTRDG